MIKWDTGRESYWFPLTERAGQYAVRRRGYLLRTLDVVDKPLLLNERCDQLLPKWIAHGIVHNVFVYNSPITVLQELIYFRLRNVDALLRAI